MKKSNTDITTWYKDWFNTHYYHILYYQRNEAEASAFISKLIKKIDLQPGKRVLDLCCGKGRHSIFLHKAGMDVTGIDLSENSISCAKQHEQEKLEFFVHDMRNLFRTNYYDLVLNLFTSFGYFKRDIDDLKVLTAVHHDLKPGGLFILDYLNSDKILSYGPSEGERTVEGIHFSWKKKIQNGFIEKDIFINDKGVEHKYSERVKLITHQQFQSYLQQTGFKVLQEWGGYELELYNKEQSDRYIVLTQKI